MEATTKSEKLKVACQHCSLQRLCLPLGLSDTDIRKLDEIIKRPKPLDKNRYLFKAGDKFRSISVVRAGSIKSYITTKSGEQQIIAFHLPGELLGFDGVSEDVHACTAVALEQSSVCQLPFGELEDLTTKIPGLQRQLHRIMSRELVEEQHMLLQIGSMNATQRLAAFLVNYSVRLQLRGYSGNEFNLSMSRTDIGNYIGLTIETVSRLFSQYRNDGLISTDKKLITILRPEKLHEISGIQSCRPAAT